MANDDIEIRIANLIKDIDVILDNFVSKEKKPSTLEMLIIQEIREMNFILRLILLEIDEQNEIMEDGIKGNEKMESFNHYFFLNQQLRIHIKSFYHWIYNLKNLINKHPQSNKLISEDIYTTLDRHCLIRHKLLTHKENMVLYPAGGAVGKLKTFEYRLNIFSLKPTEKAIKDVGSVFRKCKKYLNTKDASEENYFERLVILYRKYESLDECKSDVKKIITKYGTSTESPIVLLEFLKELCKDIIYNLSKLDED